MLCLRIIIYYIYLKVIMQRIHSDQHQLNALKLKRLLDSGVASIPIDKKHKNAILVIGDTGVGKTTILSFLAKRKLFIKIHGLNTILDSDDKDGLKIGHDRFSETRVPQKIVLDNMIFFDCSGFKDNRGEEYEISNSFFLKRLFGIYDKIKILLIVDENSISESRADKLPKLIRNLLKSFQSLEDIQDGVILLINKTKPEFTLQNYEEELLKMLKVKGEDVDLFTREERNFIQYLVKKDKICLFKQPKMEDEGKLLDVKEENLLNLIKDTNFVKSKKIHNIISESAKLSIRDFIDRLSQTAEEKVQKLCDTLVKDICFNYHLTLEGAQGKKQIIMTFLEQVNKSNDEQLIEVIRQYSHSDIVSFEQDVSTALFFKDIYNKADFYFSTVRTVLAKQLAMAAMKIDEQVIMFRKMGQLERNLSEKSKQVQRLSVELADANMHNEAFALQTSQLTKHYNQSMNELHSQLDNKSMKVTYLKNLLNEMKNERQSFIEEIQVLSIENESLKMELSEQLNKNKEDIPSSINTSQISISSSTSKYPFVNCPHFKNGGKCINCIKSWKKEEMKKKIEDKEKFSS